ncbi:MAG: Unknown protein [uncultured Sulfurovum sp.]|uniref:Uncharacterized protein n=1 Tax=uncultured Sulfurovum sp. TaxID=269237 RepID=A0A6S6TQX4_9BACT|nr:MAG: Unknown protein [uncultured Sulfurovum sp.]
MEILINELSLTGQFKDENEFLDNFDSILKMIKLIDKLNFSIAKEFMFFDVAVTANHKLSDFLRLRTDRAKKMKQFLAKLAQNPPFWNEIQKHNCSQNTYNYNSNDICNTSLAESSERDRIVLSFKHNDFLNIILEIQKNNTPMNIYNLIDKHHFLGHLLSTSQIEPLKYCQFKFENTNLNFSKIEDDYGFNLLETSQQRDEFIDSFKKVSQMSWQNIINSDGLQYKRYKGKEFGNQPIYKFRVTQKYRCFGYREEDIFFILRFEIDHKMSDNG